MFSLWLIIVMFIVSFFAHVISSKGKRRFIEYLIMAAFTTLMAWGALELVQRLFVGRPI